MYWPLRLLQCPQSDCEYSCLDGKGIWQLGVKILQKSYHTTLSHSHKIFMGGKKPRKVVASAQVRDSRELNRRNVYMAFLGGGTFQSDLEIEGLCGLILGQAQRLLGFFFLLGLWVLGMAVSTIREVWGQGLVVGAPQGQGKPLCHLVVSMNSQQ